MKRGLSFVFAEIVKPWRCLPRWDRWFAIPFVFVFFALVGWVPGLYVRATEIPPFEQLQRTSGNIFFESGGRGGWVTKLKTEQGVMAFSCWTGGRGSGCISTPPGHSLKEWQNHTATVWWFSRPNPYSKDQFATQIQIDNVIVKPYEESVKGLSIAQKTSNWFTPFWVGFPFAYLFFRIWRLRSKESMDK